MAVDQDTQHPESWIGKSRREEETIEGAPMRGLKALLDHQDLGVADGADLLPVGHWLHFLNPVRQSQLGRDGHPVRGDFMPPIDLPRRMYGGSRIRYQAPIRVGQPVSRLTTIKNVVTKQGGSGQLVFVTVALDYSGPDGPFLSEEQDIIYRQDPAPNATPPAHPAAPDGADWTQAHRPDPVLLMRFSALIGNSHRIHYDLPYVTQVEKYPGLIVHGPLTATLMIEAFCVRHPEVSLTTFDFRALSPLYCDRDMAVCGRISNTRSKADLWAENDSGELAMTGSVSWR